MLYMRGTFECSSVTNFITGSFELDGGFLLNRSRKHSDPGIDHLMQACWTVNSKVYETLPVTCNLYGEVAHSGQYARRQFSRVGNWLLEKERKLR